MTRAPAQDERAARRLAVQNLLALRLVTLRLVAMSLMALALAAPVRADVFRPAYLQLQQLDGETYDVKWRVPALDAQTTLRVRPVFPPGTVELSPRQPVFAGGHSLVGGRCAPDAALAGRAARRP